MTDRKLEPTHSDGHPMGDLQIFDIMDELTNEHPGALDEPFPDTWSDPLELYGCYRASLERRQMDMNRERKAIRDLMTEDHYSPSTIWLSRLGLVAERIVTRLH